MRHCPACGKELVRHQGEKHAYFVRRKYCDHDCAVKGRSVLAEQHRLEQDLADHDPPELLAAMSFDRAEILRAAHRAAPQVPVSLLADVVAEVEPLIASNTRRLLMHQVAQRYRGEHA
jgi:hypothetical protein